jgi:hypothetical protein
MLVDNDLDRWCVIGFIITTKLGKHFHITLYLILLIIFIFLLRSWWFYLQSVLHHYIAISIVQPKISGDYKQDALRVMFALNDKSYSRSFLDSFEVHVFRPKR